MSKQMTNAVGQKVKVLSYQGTTDADGARVDFFVYF